MLPPRIAKLYAYGGEAATGEGQIRLTFCHQDHLSVSGPLSRFTAGPDFPKRRRNSPWDLAFIYMLWDYDFPYLL
jgi:hypothetical protein